MRLRAMLDCLSNGCALEQTEGRRRTGRKSRNRDLCGQNPPRGLEYEWKLAPHGIGSWAALIKDSVLGEARRPR